MKNTSWLLIVVAFFSFLNHKASADWKAKMLVKSTDGKLNVEAKAFAKGNFQRFDVNSMGQDVSTIIDLKAYKATLLMHSAKIAMNTAPNPRGATALCVPTDIEGCFKRQGLKKTRDEKWDGHPCSVYEGTMNSGKPDETKVKLYRPTDLKEVASIKSEFYPKTGKSVVITLTDIKTEAQADSLFVIPDKYKKMDGLDLNALLQMQQKNPPAKK